MNDKISGLQMKGGIKCLLEGEGEEKKVTAKIDDSYQFTK